MAANQQQELDGVIRGVLESPSPKKLIVAGPGTGKTTLFRELLERAEGDPTTRIVLTFINNLKKDLEDDLGDLASVFTLHGFCQYLLYKHEFLRGGLSSKFRCVPGLASIIKADWRYIVGTKAPRFVELMRHLNSGDETEFYIGRGDYYDAVDFDDSVFRVATNLSEGISRIQQYDLVLVDEYQDFNQVEAAVVDSLAANFPIVIAGDDDQALYSTLRDATWELIRSLHKSEEFEKHELPYCMRCPEVVVESVNDMIRRAQGEGLLGGRIDKPYRHFEPVKGDDSARYPSIDLVRTSVQRNNANYFGRYVLQEIEAIPHEEIEEATEKGIPTALIIGPRQYRNAVVNHLEEQGYLVETSQPSKELSRSDGLAILKEEPTSNVGWRIILHFEGDEELAAEMVSRSHEACVALVEVLPDRFREEIMKEVDEWEPDVEDPGERPSEIEEERTETRIKATTFEGAKGLSAQHVFILGLHQGDMPSGEVGDIDVCKFVVALTRTRKKCSLLLTKRYADNKMMEPSLFLRWIENRRFDVKEVNAKYWKKRED